MPKTKWVCISLFLVSQEIWILYPRDIIGPFFSLNLAFKERISCHTEKNFLILCILYVGLIRKCLSQKVVNADDNPQKIVNADEIREILFKVKMRVSQII
jgi:hypothetical protein